jgi:DNA-binding phage protein
VSSGVAGDVVSAEDAVTVLLSDARPVLDERQRRLTAAAGARALGRGGIAAVARETGMSRSTISKGVRELEQGPYLAGGRVRRPGAGRKRATERDRGLVAALAALVEGREDPDSPLRWTCKSTRQLADTLTAAGHPTSHVRVGELLRFSLGFTLQPNAKAHAGKLHRDRNAQFHYINEQVRRHIRAGHPVISVDSEKKELIGADPACKHTGYVWQRKNSPDRVGARDFPDPEVPTAIPRGIYGVHATEGFAVVERDRDTATFAAETLWRWWRQVGSVAYPNASELLICADAGGSYGYRVALWNIELGRLAAGTGLAITVCHLPAGTSKWNRVEHRLFSAISMNWRGRPLTSHEIVVELIGPTMTSIGLKVHADHETGAYPKGSPSKTKPPRRVALTPHEFHGEWNYTVTPQ